MRMHRIQYLFIVLLVVAIIALSAACSDDIDASASTDAAASASADAAASASAEMAYSSATTAAAVTTAATATATAVATSEIDTYTVTETALESNSQYFTNLPNNSTSFEAYSAQAEPTPGDGRPASPFDGTTNKVLVDNWEVVEEFVLIDPAKEYVANAGYLDTYAGYLGSLEYLEEYETQMSLAKDTASQVYTTGNAWDAWDVELNKIYSLLIDKLPLEEIDNLRKIENQWIKERDKTADDIAAEFEGGTYQPVAFNTSKFQSTKQRTFELVYIYFNYEWTKSLAYVPAKTFPFKTEGGYMPYALAVMDDEAGRKTMQLFSAASNQPQDVHLEGPYFVDVDFYDVNSDGNADIVVNTGGSWNETHVLYIWDDISRRFVKAEYRGFEMLASFEVFDGYIKNFVRGSGPDDSTTEKLVWDGNVLSKDFEWENINRSLDLLFRHLYGDEGWAGAAYVKFCDVDDPDGFHGYEYQLYGGANPMRIEYAGMSSDNSHYLFWLNEQVYHDGEFDHAATSDFFAVNVKTYEIIAQRGEAMPADWNDDFPW